MKKMRAKFYLTQVIVGQNIAIKYDKRTSFGGQIFINGHCVFIESGAD